MIEVPLNFILINPLVDIFIFILISYYFIFKLYKKLLNSDFKKISWVDLEVSIIFISLAYLNYSATKIDIFGFNVDWLLAVILVQLFVESIFIFIYWEDVKKYTKKIKKSNKISEEESLKNTISDLKVFKKIMEEDLNKYKIQGNKVSMEKISREIENIESEISRFQEKLSDLKK